MNREIKFRAWDKELKKMRVNPVLHFTPQSKFTVSGYSGQLYELMQYTGLKDKNGKEIYEGDIVCFVEDVVAEVIGGYPRTEPEGRFLKVGWNDEFLSWYLWDERGGGQSMDSEEEYEVIGNIYENPDILSG